jgi:hypothetical protein
MSNQFPLLGQPSVSSSPPYNATNFTTANLNVYSTLQTYGHTQPQYPLDTGSNADQIVRQQQNITYFSYIQQKAQNGSPPVFKTQTERLMYIQGQYATASRNLITGQNTSAPAGVPFYMAPSAPVLMPVMQDRGTITLTWMSVICSLPNQSAEVQNLTYIVYITDTSTQVTSTYNNNVSSPYTISGLAAGTYSCRVAAQFPIGNIGPSSAAQIVTVL